MNDIIKLFSIISFQKIIKGKMQKDPLGFGFLPIDSYTFKFHFNLNFNKINQCG